MELVQSTFLRALGWSLIDSVWQMGILWVLFLAITRNGRRFSASKRHTLGLFSLAGGSAWFMAELIFNLLNPGRIAFNSIRQTLMEDFSALNPGIEPVLPILSLVYLIVCSILFFKLITQYRSTRKLTIRGLHKISPELRVFTEVHAGQLNIGRKIHIWLSSYIDSPLTIGFWKPVILLPLAVINQLSVEQTEAIILHELNHIRRNDYLVNLVVAFSTVVLFFNPFARLLTIILRNERENSCDDLVLQFKYQPLQYAEALLLLEKDRTLKNCVQMQATGTNRLHLFERVKRILTGEPATTPVSHRMLAVFIGFLLVGFVGWYRPSNQLSEALIPSLADGFVRMESVDNPAPVRKRTISEPVHPELFLEAIRPLALKQPDLRSKAPTSPHQDATIEFLADFQPEEPETNPHANFTTESADQEFSIYEKQLESITLMDPNANHPYVPASTMEFTEIADTAVPKQISVTPQELEAREAMQQAMIALNEIDWLKLQNELKSNGSNVDIAHLQKELKKAIGDVNWKKLSAELEAARSQTMENESQVSRQLQRYQQQQAWKQQKLSAIREMALSDRLSNNASRTEKSRKIVSL